MKKHLDLDVTGLTALHPSQFSEHHETPLEDFGIRPVLPGNETFLRKYTTSTDVNKVRSIPHSQLRGGQMVVGTRRAYDMAANGRKGKDPIQGVELPSGEVMLRDGHHGVVADVINGKTSSRVLVTRKMHPLTGPHLPSNLNYDV